MSNVVKRFKVTLTTLEPFRIGALQNVLSGVNNPVATVGGKVVVQGSTLKGALRSEIERYLIEEYQSENNNNMMPCIPSSVRTLSLEEQGLIKKKLYRENGGCVYSMRRKSESICPACYLLGAQGLPGFVRVPCLYTDATAEDLYSVRVDRATGVVAESTNREYQIMAKDTVFEGNLEIALAYPTRDWIFGEPRCENDEWLKSGEWTRGKIIKELILDRLEAITMMGGFKSKGCGKVEIKVDHS